MACKFLIPKTENSRKGENKQFFLMFLITYSITILMAVLIAIMNIDEAINQAMINPDIELVYNNWGELIKNIDNTFSFYNCETISFWSFVSAKIIETLVPTTITFSGAILVLQRTIRKDSARPPLLFSLLVIIAMIGIAFTQAKSQIVLELYMATLLILIIISLLISRKIYYQQNLTQHKNEPDDGKITRKG